MGKRNIHILIEKFFENDLSPEIQKKFHAWLLDRNFQEEKEKAMVTLWEEKSAVANESTFQELSRLHKRIEASDRMQLAYISRELPPYYFCRCLVLSVPIII